MYYGLSDPFLSQYPYVRRRGPSQRPQFFGCVVFYGHVLLQTMALRQNGAGSQTERAAARIAACSALWTMALPVAGDADATRPAYRTRMFRS